MHGLFTCIIGDINTWKTHGSFTCIIGDINTWKTHDSFTCIIEGINTWKTHNIVYNKAVPSGVGVVTVHYVYM